MAEDTSAEDEFGVSAEDEFGVNDHGPLGGHFSDVLFQTVHPFSTILNHIGAGIEQGWGAAGNEQETLNKVADTDYLKSKNAYLKGINENFIRPAAYAATLLGQAPLRAITAIGGGIYGAVEGTAEALGEAHKAIQDNPNIDPSTKLFANPVGAPAELAGIAASMPDLGGEFMGPHAIENTVARARATASVGEGERGFFNTVPVSPENLNARVEASKEAGMPPPFPPEPPQTDIHSVARMVDPDTFQEWDRLKELQDNLRLSLDYLGGKRGEDQERAITTILARTGGDESALSEGEASRLANYRAALDKANSMDSVPMAETRQRIQDADTKLRDLIPKIQDAKERTQRMLEGTDPESYAFRDFVQAQALENSIKLQDLHNKVVEAYRNADTLIPEKPPSTGKAPPAEEETFERSTVDPTANKVQPSPAGSEAAKEGTTAPTQTIGNGVRSGGEGGLKSIPGTGETKTRGLAKNVSADAVEKGLTEEFKDLPEYKKINLKVQAVQVANLINSDPKLAYQIAMGKMAAPEGIIPEMVFQGIRDAAKAANDVETLRKLATESDLVRQSTVMAQRLRALAESVDNTDPVAAMKVVQDAREALLSKPNLKATRDRVLKAAKEALKNAAPKTDEWNEFLDSITCK